MNFYERVTKIDIPIPGRLDMTYGQMRDIRKNAPGIFESMYICFRFGYVQGMRAAKLGKAVERC